MSETAGVPTTDNDPVRLAFGSVTSADPVYTSWTDTDTYTSSTSCEAVAFSCKIKVAEGAKFTSNKFWVKPLSFIAGGTT